MSATQDFDTGPLNWVRNDIEAALKGATDRVRAYGTDSTIENAFRLAQDEAHLATGALRMVGLEGAAKMAGALEDVLVGMDSKSIAAEPLHLKIVLDALGVLLKWVGRMADGRGEGELALFPSYRKLRNLSGVEQVFEGELFFPNLKVRPAAESSVELSAEELAKRVKSARSLFQRGLLAFLRGTKPEAGLTAMRNALSDVGASVNSPAASAFWWACIGFVDALQNKGIEPDFNVKQLLARIDLQMRRLMEGSPQVAERLMRDALFFVATSKSLGGESNAVRAAFDLEKYLPKHQYLDAEQLARARPVLKSLKETLIEQRNHWDAYSEGKQEAAAAFGDATARLADQVGALNIEALKGLIAELNDTASAIGQLDEHLREAAQLEIATTLLFLQNAVDNEDILDPAFIPRAQSQTRRLSAARAGKAESGASDLLDESGQKAAEHALLVQLGKEIGNSLIQVEELLDVFFRDPDMREGLTKLDALSAQIQGALAILDQSAAAHLLQSVTDGIKPYVLAGAPSDDEKVRIAEALSSIGGFVEAHCAGRQNAAGIMRVSQVAYGLLEDDAPEDEAHTVEAGLPGRKAAVASAYLDWHSDNEEASLKKCLAALTELSHDADLIADVELKSATAAAIQGLSTQQFDANLGALLSALTGQALPAPVAISTATSTESPELEMLGEELSLVSESVPMAEAAEQTLEAPGSDQDTFEYVTAEADAAISADMAEIELDAIQPSALETPEENNLPDQVAAAEPVTRPAPVAKATQPAPQPDQDPVDPELLEIFLEEAQEVLGNLLAAAEACSSNADDHENLVVIRRAFHTLKGSGRMVGLMAFGETAWGMEQLMNGWLANEKPATAVLLDAVRNAHAVFDEWVAALQDNSAAWIDTSALLTQAVSVAHGEEPVAAINAPEPVQDVVVTAQAETEAQIEEIDEEIELAEPELVEVAEPTEICIGDVCMSPGLFEVFKAESAQWAHTLSEEVMRLDMAAPAPVSALMQRGVHTLAGVAGTTGFVALSELSAAAESYFRRLEENPIPALANATLQDAVTEICNMIQGIHAGNAPESANALIDSLSSLTLEQPVDEKQLAEAAFDDLLLQAEGLEIEAPLEAVTAEEATEPAAQDIAQDTEEFIAVELATTEAELAEFVTEETVIEETITAETVTAETVTVEPSVEMEIQPVEPVVEEVDLQEMIEQARKKAAPVFEQRDVQDEIDADLLPIFLEEAETLVPEATRAMREWIAAPDASDSSSALQRVLHTIKGSARMAGAMRLGELTHIIESRVISIVQGQIQADAAVFHGLEEQCDRLADTVERLRTGAPEPAISHIETEVTDADVIVSADASATSDAPLAPVTHIGRAAAAQPAPLTEVQQRDSATLRVRADWVDRMVNQAGEVAIMRSRVESEMFAVKRQVAELSEALRRIKSHLREVEIQAESQMQATFQSQADTEQFDPLEFDRFTRFQEVTRFMAESVHDVSTVQQNLVIQLGEADAALLQQSRINRELQQNLLRVRMVPLYSVSERLYRVVRQAARDADKRAQLDISGGDLEMDRSVLEKVVAPLEHLLRNAIAHGLENSDQRAAAGKREFGEVQLIARHEGNEMMLIIKDDGAGLNLGRIREKALAQGLLSPGMEPSENQLAQMIFVAGFSTASEITQLAGRGVGMDVVKNEIASLGGRIEIATETGKGVTFTIYLPLTLAVTQAVIIRANKHEYALPATLVEQVQEFKPEQLEAAMQARAIAWRGANYPLYYLPHLLGQPEAVHEEQRYSGVVLMKSGATRAAFLVDEIEGAREIVIKNIGPQLSRVSGIAGATVRGDGKVILILNPVPLALRALSMPQEMVEVVPVVAEPEAITKAPLVLVVDDSLTVRKITTRLMNREGYRVDTAKDGVDALEKMHDILPDVVLLDVEMPRMDGFELARVMHNDERLSHIPIIMITSRTADKHRNHAMELGVKVYLGKPFQEAVLLGHIADLMGERAMMSL